MFGPVNDPNGPYGIGIILAASQSDAERLRDDDPAVRSSHGFRLPSSLRCCVLSRRTARTSDARPPEVSRLPDYDGISGNVYGRGVDKAPTVAVAAKQGREMHREHHLTVRTGDRLVTVDERMSVADGTYRLHRSGGRGA